MTEAVHSSPDPASEPMSRDRAMWFVTYTKGQFGAWPLDPFRDDTPYYLFVLDEKVTPLNLEDLPEPSELI